jgi:hypothetical protein
MNRDAVVASSRRAMQSLLDESDKIGVPMTGWTVAELDRHLRLVADAPAAVRRALDEASSVAVRRSSQRGRIVPPGLLSELAATSRVPAMK